MTFKRASVVATLVAASALTLRGAPAPHRAHLSDDLFRHLGRRTTARARVIVHGDQATVDGIAARHHLQVLRRMEHSAVLAANSDALDPLSADPAPDHLSSDPPVSNSMSVSSQSTAADQVRAGTAGLLLGIGGVPGVTGQGGVVAVVDSGISAHSALYNKVGASVSFVSDDPRGVDV